MYPSHRLPRNFRVEATKKTFLKGGYYRHDFGIEKISLLSLNSIYFHEQNKCLFEEADEQMQWFKQQLQTAKYKDPKRRFIVSMHIFPGVDYKGEHQDLWHENYTNTFLDILQEYDTVDLMLGSFVPREEPRVSKSKLFPKVATP